jgi:hypothetical protein
MGAKLGKARGFTWQPEINLDDGRPYVDLLIGVYLAGASNNEDGKASLLYGGSNLTAGVAITSGPWGVNISDCVDVTFSPADSGDGLRYSVAGEDLNGDGYDDVILSAPQAAPDGRTGAGETYAFYGASILSSTITFTTFRQYRCHRVGG